MSFIHVQAIVQHSSALSRLLHQLGELCCDFERNASRRLKLKDEDVILKRMNSALKLVNVLCSVKFSQSGHTEQGRIQRFTQIWTVEKIRTATFLSSTNQHFAIDILSLVFLHLSNAEADSAAKEAPPPREWRKGEATYANSSFTSQDAHSSEHSREGDDVDVVHQMMYWVLCVFASISAYKPLDDSASIQEKFLNSPHFYEVAQRIRRDLETEDNWTGNATLVPFTR